MKQIISFFLIAITMLIAQTTVAQEELNYRDIAFEYVLQNISSIEARPWSVESATYDKMPNGDCLVKLTISRTLTRQEDRLVNNQVQAYGATFNVGVRNATVNIDYDQTKSYFVFVDRFGEPSKYMEASTNHEFKYWGGNVWLIMNKHKEKVGSKELSFYNNIACFSNKGETLWSGRDIKIYGWAFTGKTLYMAGTFHSNGIRVVRSIDVKTLQPTDEIISSKAIPSDISFTDKGVKITKYASNGQSSDFMVRYALRDRQFQIEQVLKNYDLKKASDQIALGERYLNGNVVDKDEKRAVELFEKAANQNSDIGMLKLAECYKKGVGVTKDNAKAFSLYDKSANMGNSDAMIALSDMYAEGNGIEKNMSKALYWKEKLAFKGNLNAQKYVLANQSVNYEKYDISADNALTVARESHKDGNYDWAKFCYERAISLGSKDAMFDYGKWLYEGNGITKDYNKAVEYLTQLGEENNVNAQMLLKKIYKENKGIAPDVKKEMYWAVKAAENGDVDSQLSLGYAYKNGIGVKKDKKLAFAMYEKAAEQGNQDAIKEVFYLYITGNGVKKNADNAYLWFDKLDADNQIEVANSFVEGIKVKSNKETGFWLYVRAAKNDDPNALKKVALCYFYGIGVKSDLLTAYNIANKIKTITSKEDDGDLYYIEGKYYESTHRSTALIKQCYERAVAYGNKDAIEALSSFYKKYGY